MAVLAKIIVFFDQKHRKNFKDYTNLCAEDQPDGAAVLGAIGYAELPSTHGNRLGDPVLSP